MPVNKTKKQQPKTSKQPKADGTRSGVFHDWRGEGKLSRTGKHRVGNDRDGQ